MRPFVRASKLDQSDYDQAIAKGLTRAYDATKPEPVELAQLRVVVISDLHRGARDGADDFERAEAAYSAALGWYLEERYQLFLLGDVEELWENDLEEVVPDSYRALLDLEAKFASERGGPGLRRFWGNHDLDWKDQKKVKRKLGTFLPGVPAQEALILDVQDGSEPIGRLFFVHGHQGTDFSERFQFISRFFVRRVWRKVQRSQGWLSTTPAHDYVLRAKHDTAMFRWARGRIREGRKGDQPILIAGHTHHPVIPGHPPPEPKTEDLEDLRKGLEQARKDKADVDRIAAIRAELEGVEGFLRRKRYPAPELDEPPCYFNGGCCCYPDGDVTCLELDGAADEIRLVRFPRDRPEADRSLPAVPLRETFRKVALPSAAGRFGT
jgi:UDP-2,3-diacylglucosamine pyrophosphatase LpxH